MRFLDKLFTRRRRMPRFEALGTRVRHRLSPVCRELSEAEDALAAHLGLARPPRLLLVDEEEAVVLTPDERTAVGRDDAP